MSKKRRGYSAQFKFRVAMEAIKEKRTVNEIASEHQIHPTLVRDWKRQLLNGGASVFERGHKAPSQKETEALDQYLRQIMTRRSGTQRYG